MCESVGRDRQPAVLGQVAPELSIGIGRDDVALVVMMAGFVEREDPSVAAAEGAAVAVPIRSDDRTRPAVKQGDPVAFAGQSVGGDEIDDATAHERDSLSLETGPRGPPRPT